MSELRRSHRRRPALLPGLRPALLASATAIPRCPAGRERAAPPSGVCPTDRRLPAAAARRRRSDRLAAALLGSVRSDRRAAHMWPDRPARRSLAGAVQSVGPSIVKIEGTLPAAAATSAPTTTSPTSTQASQTKAATSKSAPATEAQEVKEVKEAETAKAKPKPASKPSAATLQKLSSSKGKTHQQEIEKLTSGDKPIETGG